MKRITLIILGIFLMTTISSCDKESSRSHTYEIMKDAVTDIDGNHYDAVQIGEQIWMIQNLRTTRFADGTEIPLSTEPTVYFGSNWPVGTPYRWAPNDDAMNADKFGWLYNWDAVVRGDEGSQQNPSGLQGICPDGWHVPSDAEWTELTDYVSSDRKMRSSPRAESAIAQAMAAQTDWEQGTDKGDVGYDLSKNNATGFSALPAGIAGFTFHTFGNSGYFWTSTKGGYYQQAYIRCFHSANNDVFRNSWSTEEGLSVRCVKD